LKNFVAFAVLVTAALTLSACGSNSPTGGTTTPTPTPTVTKTLVTEGGFNKLEAEFIGSLTFTTSRAGTISTNVDWTFSTNEVWVAIAAGNDPCTNADGLFNPSQCTFLVSDNTTAKPKALATSSQPAGTYTVYIRNIGPGTESASYQIFLAS
jgi:hypothetical protein